MRLTAEHFEQARRAVRRWRQRGFDQVVVVRQTARAKRGYPCRRQDVPRRAVAGWDHYPIPTLDRLNESAPAEESASRAELWVAATIAHGCKYRVATSVA